MYFRVTARSMFELRVFCFVRTRSNLRIPMHSHDESVFRVLLSGSLRINGRTVDTPGTWFVVRQGVKYAIETDEGYATLTGYGTSCNGQFHILKQSRKT